MSRAVEGRDGRVVVLLLLLDERMGVEEGGLLLLLDQVVMVVERLPHVKGGRVEAVDRRWARRGGVVAAEGREGRVRDGSQRGRCPERRHTKAARVVEDEERGTTRTTRRSVRTA